MHHSNRHVNANATQLEKHFYTPEVFGSANRQRKSNLAFCVVFQICDQPLDILKRHRIIIACSDATNAAMALEALQKTLLRPRQKFLLFVHIPAEDAETHVHSAACGLVRHHMIDIRILVQRFVNQRGLAVGDLLLSTDFGVAKGFHKMRDDLASDPKVEDGQCVVQ